MIFAMRLSRQFKVDQVWGWHLDLHIACRPSENGDQLGRLDNDDAFPPPSHNANDLGQDTDGGDKRLDEDRRTGPILFRHPSGNE